MYTFWRAWMRSLEGHRSRRPALHCTQRCCRKSSMLRAFSVVRRHLMMNDRSLTPRLIAVWVLIALGTGCGDQTTQVVIHVDSPAGPGSAEPHLAGGHNETAVLSWLEPTNDGVALRYASFADKAWTPPRTVTQGTDWFVNWADFPSVVPISDSLWAAHWLAKRPGGTYAYDVAMALSLDGGETWGTPLSPHTDGTQTEHGFVSLFAWHDAVGALWLDGRNMTEDGHATNPGAGAGMTLRSAAISGNGDLAHEHLIDELVCDCCQTDIALTTNGPVAAYRNRTPEEIRDIYVTRFVDGDWQPGSAVADDGWEISGCPVNGPAIVAQDNLVGIAWFTAAQGRSIVRFARSEDAASTFSTALDIDAERAIGRVDIAMLDDGAMAVSWLRRGLESQGEIVVRRVTSTGVLGPPKVIAKTVTSRPTGFPQMIRVGDDLLVAWTHIADGESTVKTARMSVAALR